MKVITINELNSISKNRPEQPVSGDKWLSKEYLDLRYGDIIHWFECNNVDNSDGIVTITVSLCMGVFGSSDVVTTDCIAEDNKIQMSLF